MAIGTDRSDAEGGLHTGGQMIGMAAGTRICAAVAQSTTGGVGGPVSFVGGAARVMAGGVVTGVRSCGSPARLFDQNFTAQRVRAPGQDCTLIYTGAITDM